MENKVIKEVKIPRRINYKIIDNIEEIKRYLNIGNYIPNDVLTNDVRFILFRKYLTHSDLVNIGKGNFYENGYQKRYILYYDNIKELEKYTTKLPIAKQSNITLPSEFYDVIMKESLEYIGRWRNIASKYTCLIPKSIKADFNLEDIDKISKKNGKNSYKNADRKFSELENYSIDYNENFLMIDRVSIAAHGIGVKSDKALYGLRSLMFKGDVLNILVNLDDRILYIVPERNERYYFEVGKINKDYSNLPIYKLYESKEKEEIIEYLAYKDILEGKQPNIEVNKSELEYFEKFKTSFEKIREKGSFPRYRWYQRQWKEALIKSLALQLNESYILRCAISGYTTNNKKLEYMFIASHIKSYSDCAMDQEWEEAFDPNNGLILISNVDKLFDKHDISIDENGFILKSSACESLTANYNILPKDKIGEYYLTERRKKYLSYHYNIFKRDQ